MDDPVDSFYLQGIRRIQNLGEDFSEDNPSRREKLWIAVLCRLKTQVQKKMSSDGLSSADTFILIQLNHSIEGIITTYLSLKYRRLRAVNRDLRFTLESHILADYSINNESWAKEKAQQIVDEGEEYEKKGDKDFMLGETTSDISNKASTLRQEMEEEVEGMSKYYQWLGTTGSHPYDVTHLSNGDNVDGDVIKKIETIAMQLTAANTILFYSRFATPKEMERNYMILTGMFGDLFSELDNSLHEFLCYRTDVEEVTNNERFKRG